VDSTSQIVVGGINGLAEELKVAAVILGVSMIDISRLVAHFTRASITYLDILQSTVGAEPKVWLDSMSAIAQDYRTFALVETRAYIAKGRKV
jgi:hypothetical protein